MKQQNAKFENNIIEKMSKSTCLVKQFDERLSEIIESHYWENERVEKDTGKCNKNKNKLNEAIDNKVCNSENNSDNYNNDDVIENGVSESCLLYTSRCV